MNYLNIPGFISGAFVWFLILYYAAGEGECVAYANCGREDMVIFGIVSVGLLVPAFFVSVLVSGLFNRNR